MRLIVNKLLLILVTFFQGLKEGSWY